MKRKLLIYLIGLFVLFLSFNSFATANINFTNNSLRLVKNTDFNDESLRLFAKNFIVHMYQYGHSYNNLSNRESFLNILNENNHTEDENLLKEIYASHGLDFEFCMDKINLIHNDIELLQNANPELINENISEQDMWRNIINAIDVGFSSNLPEWEIVKNEIEENLANECSCPGLTGQEVWDCLKNAVGLSLGAGLTVGAGAFYSASTIIKHVSKMLVRSFGWWGAALFIVDFTVCINEELHD